MKVNTLIFCLIVLLFAGCTHSQLWEKTGGNQQSFDLDSRECELIAHQDAMLQSETGRKADPSSFSKTYIECLGAKGWSKKTVVPESQKESNSETVQQLAEVIHSNIITGFEQTITVPETYKLL